MLKQGSQNRKIVFINQATGYLTIDIINEFARYIDKVALITGSIRVQDMTLDAKTEVTYTTKYNRGNVLLKAFSWILGTLQIQYQLRYKYRDYERFYFTIPPLSYILASKLKTPYSLLVYDLYPDALISFGFTRKNLIFRWWTRRNCKIFESANQIYTISSKMKSGIEQYCKRQVHVIPNWSAFYGLQVITRENNALLAEQNIREKFIVEYSGNIGMTHQVEVLIDVAELFKNMPDILFLIIGRGRKTDEINDLIVKKNLGNCMMLPFRKDEQLFDSLCAADVAVITLDDKSTDISIPSKIYNIMAAGLPVLAIASPDSEVASMLNMHKNGETFIKSDINGMFNYIKKLKENSAYKKSLSENSLIASQQYTRVNAKKYCETYLNSNV